MSSTLGGLDKRRLRLGLAVFFLALAVPSAVLVYQAFNRLEWEGFHQQQVLAQELVQRLDARLADLLDAESSRSFADYAFLVVEGDPKAGYLQRSPLSSYPPRPEIPGLIGYFQVDAQGAFSSPLLPRGSVDPTAYGLTRSEVAERGAAENRLEQILSSNRLVERKRGEGGAGEEARPTRQSDGLSSTWSSAGGPLKLRKHESGIADEADAVLGGDRTAPAEEAVKTQAATRQDARVALQPKTAGPRQPARAQLAFDRLNEGQSDQQQVRAAEHADLVEAGRGAQRPNGSTEPDSQAPVRGRRQSRREIGVLPEPEAGPAPVQGAAKFAAERDNYSLKDEAIAAPAPSFPQAAPAEPAPSQPASVPAQGAGVVAATPAYQAEPSPRPPIRTFESEIDPFEASRLVDGQLVLYRKVWRDGQRYTQGALIDPAAFVQGLIGTPFREAALARTSDLEVTWRGDQLALFAGQSGRDYEARGLRGTPLYQTRLSAPLNDLGLAFFVTHLPLGPGGTVVAWVAATLAVILCGGVLALYRLGLRQIALVRQQQDFVSAVSHELKTPLTSIRMYSEMLREGWVPEDKRPGYYGFIHDESERLSRLINNVLQLARMTRNEQCLELRPVACAELIDQGRSKVSSRIDGAGFTLRLDCPAEAGATLVRTDPDAFVQILINLVDNAVKFSARAEVKEVEIGCRSQPGGTMRFWVRDHGPGVPRDQMKRIFRLFYRAEGALTRETLGTGIGLALVQGLARGMGGSVELVNRDPGAEFRLILPVEGSSVSPRNVV